MLAQFVRRAAVWSILVASAVRADVGFERAEWDPELSSFFVNVTGNNEDFDKVREAVRQLPAGRSTSVVMAWASSP